MTQGISPGVGIGTSTTREKTTGTNSGINTEIITGILLETSPGKILETSLRTFTGGTFKGVITPEIPQGETPETIPETNQEKGIAMKEATAQEEVGGLMIGVVMPAMGVDAEKVARRP